MREGYKTHVSDDKKNIVVEFAKLLSDYPIIGVLNLENLPAQQLNIMRKQLRGHGVLIKMTKQKLITLAIEKAKSSKNNLEELEQYMKGMPALLFTKENPFKLFKIIKKNKSKAAAKAGQILPSDAKVSAGPTNFAPGPIISELAAFGIKTKVEEGKLAIQEDTVIATEGTEVNDKLASMLQRLGIEPMEIGLDLTAIYENGVIFTKSVLDVDEDQFLANVNNAARWALNLSVEVGYITSDNIELLVVKAFRDGKGLATEANILCSATIKDLVGKAHSQMLSVKSTLGV